MTFTSDFFGRPESIASVSILYSLISKAVIDSLEDLGFDVSDYKDKEGNYTINAEKIDQLIVGETINNVSKTSNDTINVNAKSEGESQQVNIGKYSSGD
ncbi:MAG: hypothetical protein F6J87_12750 [Spirulina sp. SIO3F2]|nr:hypothetical protein [Spirulina sp. SIO3F2]